MNIWKLVKNQLQEWAESDVISKDGTSEYLNTLFDE